MDSIKSLAPRAILFRLDPALETNLSASLREADYTVSHAVNSRGAPISRPSIVFCPSGPAFTAAQTAFPDLPVVIVSRLPDTREWLDALEHGAADYVAAPFESIQMRWILKANSHPALSASTAA